MTTTQDPRLWAEGLARKALRYADKGWFHTGVLMSLAAIAYGLVAVTDRLEALLAAPNPDDHADQVIEEELRGANS